MPSIWSPGRVQSRRADEDEGRKRRAAHGASTPPAGVAGGHGAGAGADPANDDQLFPSPDPDPARPGEEGAPGGARGGAAVSRASRHTGGRRRGGAPRLGAACRCRGTPPPSSPDEPVVFFPDDPAASVSPPRTDSGSSTASSCSGSSELDLCRGQRGGVAGAAPTAAALASALACTTRAHFPAAASLALLCGRRGDAAEGRKEEASEAARSQLPRRCRRGCRSFAGVFPVLR
jgi:hypothetical protein